LPATYEPIATTTLGSAAATIDFTSINSSYTDLKVVIVGNTVSAAATIGLRINSDSSSNYTGTYLGGDGSTTYSAERTSSAQLYLGYYNTFGTTIPTMLSLDFFSYAGSTFKTFLINWANDQNGAGYSTRGVGLWRSTSAINTLSFFPASNNFAAGTTATLYGIKNA
jgi:hypothetical protein